MTGAPPLPRAARPLAAFPPLLREHGFAVAPEQTVGFVAAVGLLGPRDMASIHRAARATLAPPPERRDEFDALFRALFLGQTLPAPAEGAADDSPRAADDEDGGADDLPEPEEANEAGGAAAATELLSLRRFAERDEAEALRRFRRAAPEKLPRRRSRRRAPARRGGGLDMRRALRQAARHDGEALELPRRRRRRTARRIVLLVDISGSMKERTDAHLRFAHALVRAGGRVEVFTVGTRLTRVTRSLALANRERALERAAGAVADWDGGTRLGDALAAFLAVPRFAGFARGALAIVLSDGLERGGPEALEAAAERLSRLAWRLVWLTPLADGPDWRPETGAMRAILPHIDLLDAAGGTAALCRRALALEEALR